MAHAWETTDGSHMAEPGKTPGAAEHPQALRSIASKYTVLTLVAMFWVAGMMLAYEIQPGASAIWKWILLSVIVTLVSAAMFRVTSRLITRPLTRLRQGIETALEGRLEPVVVSGAGDEIQLLIESFNRMLEKMDASQQKVLQQNEQLEQGIRERTAQLEKAAAEAQGANRAKSEFLANISHELRTPMNGILGMLGIMLDSPTTPDLAEQLETTQRCAYSLLALLNDILDLSKIEAGKMTLERVPFDLRVMLDDCIKAHQPKARQNAVTLSLDTAPDVPSKILGDPLRIRQILSNLISNAVKFTEHGAVTLRTRTLREDAGLRLEFAVEDSGTGIPPDKLVFIFDKFTQADGSISRKYGGTGLGLAITKKLVELHGGEIRVRSEVGQGTTFEVSLPCGVEGVDAGRESGAAMAVTGMKSVACAGRILVVEDNHVNQKVVTSVLAKRGFSIELANDGREALDKLELDAAFDLILMDVQMPRLDGLEATRLIRSDPRWKSLPIVAMTAHAMTGDRERCLQAGMDGYISKPVHPTHLLNTIDEYRIQKAAGTGS